MIAQEPLHASLWRALRERCETKPGRKLRPAGADCRYPFCCCIEANDAEQTPQGHRGRQAPGADMEGSVMKIGDHVEIKPLEDMPGRIVEIVCTAEEGWIYVVRYIADSEAKTMKCFPDELETP